MIHPIKKATKDLQTDQDSLSLGKGSESTNGIFADDCQSNKVSDVMNDLNRLSKSFIDSFESLEGQVKKLNGELETVSDELQSVNIEKTEAIAENRQIQLEKQTIASSMDSLMSILPSGVIVLDEKGCVSKCNQVAVDLLGRPLSGERWLDIINRAFLPQADDGHQISLRDGRIVHLETRALDSDAGQLVVLTDMTKTRRLQSALSQQQKINGMGKMIATLAHQIRTPLSSAILYGSHLKDSDLNEKQSKQFSENLLERLFFMERQINDMLAFVRGERVEKKLVSPESFTDRVKALCDESNHPIEYLDMTPKNLATQILGDIDSLVGAIGNLVENAVDASQSDQSVKVIVQLVGKSLSVNVIDKGKGLSLAQKRKIFEPFYTTKNTGNGLGLAIAKGIAMDHQGKLIVHSPESGGCEFQFILPLLMASKKSASKSARNMDLEQQSVGNNVLSNDVISGDQITSEADSIEEYSYGS